MVAEPPSELSVGGPGTRVDLVAPLGSGATSDVWRARVDGRSAVIKIGKKRSAAAALAHEGIVSTLAFSPRLPRLLAMGTVRVDEDAAFVSERGRPFLLFHDRVGTALTLRPSALDRALTVARDIGAALADLHAVGLAHGDIKPDNIIETNAGMGLIDLGLACATHRTDVPGASLRYLARRDASIGNAKARDMIALGLVMAELCSPEIAAADDPLQAARSASWPGALQPIVRALLAPEPGARPSAHWVHDAAVRALGEEVAPPDRERHARRVRAAYLRLRRQELRVAGVADDDVARWAHDSIAHHQSARALCSAASAPTPAAFVLDPDRRLAPLPPEERQRWLVALVGTAALSWPLDLVAHLSEGQLAARLVDLAGNKRPETWSLTDLESSDTSEMSGAPAMSFDDPSDVAQVAFAVTQVPPSWAAIETIERHLETVPFPLRIAAADALRLAGELGRARSLIEGADGDTRSRDVIADILRRCGDIERAAIAASAARRDGDDPDGRAAACLARLAYDRGELETARNLLEEPVRHAATAEVLALIHARTGDVKAAASVARRGQALAQTPEARARAAATMAYVNPAAPRARTRDRYRSAAEHAVLAGAVLEEASYRTGEAATSVDLGDLDAAVASAHRAALLWEDVLDRPAMAARAWLARAAAFAAVDERHEAIGAANRAIALAEECGDRRAHAYAQWVIADIEDPGSERGRHAAERAAALLDEATGDERVHANARLHRHRSPLLDTEMIARTNDRCRHAGPKPAAASARAAWWSACAQNAPDGDSSTSARVVLAELSALADSDAAVDTIGRAMYVGSAYARALGETDALARLEVARARAAAVIVGGTRHGLADAAGACRWISQGGERAPSDPKFAIDLRQLVVALSERDDLQALLERVLDVLILWTGAERGLLLMPKTDGALFPRAARNIQQKTFHDEQLRVSTSLAERALATREAVVAIDAMEELSSSYDSVHALKLRSVLALPLIAHGQTLGVVYLDDRLRAGAFGDKEIAWAQSVAPVAALAIADARAQTELKAAIAQAQRASDRLEQSLAQKESALHIAKRELDRTAGDAHRGIIGESEVMTQMLRLADRVAVSDVPVLLLGESGSGKELVARSLHRTSPRRDHPFVGENCGALPETLLESALFGHVKGAFTGAHRPRIGLFEAADEGTLFLDEIGEMSLGMQTKLLRILEDSLVRPLGATHSRKVDVRVIAATHRDLEEMVGAGTFREDLYYRLNVIAIRIPPLRERASDIPLLVDHLISKHAEGRAVAVSAPAMRQLAHHDWPGNVRQLENEVRRALLLAEDTIGVSHLSIGESNESALAPELGLNVRARIDHLEVQLVTEALERTRGNQTQAAKLLGISRYGLHKMIKRLGIAPPKRH